MLIRYIRNDLEGVYTAEMLRGSISMLAGVAFYELTGTGAAGVGIARITRDNGAGAAGIGASGIAGNDGA